jgi:hypothetical protein
MNNTAINYHSRARAIIEALLAQVEIFAGPTRWCAPTEANIEACVEELPEVLNWCLDGAARLGYRVEYYRGPLSETQMRAAERAFGLKTSNT